MPNIAVILPVMALAWLICSHAEWLGRKFGLMDIPDPVGGRKRHDRDTPLLGGTAALLPTFTVMAFGTVLIEMPNRQIQSDLLLITMASAILYLIGLLDDRSNLSVRFRLLVSVIVASLAALSIPNLKLEQLLFSHAAQAVNLGSFGVILSILCIVGLVNATNMADGKNGLVVGCCCIWTALLFYYAPDYIRPALAALLAALLVVFLFNMRGLLFLGDGGSYGLACLIGCLSVYIYNLRFDVLPADQIALWFMVPVVDCLRLLISRQLRGLSPFAPDRCHLHHYLAARWTWERGRYIYWSLIAVPNLMAVFFQTLTPVILAVTLMAYGAIILMARRRLHPIHL